MEVPEFVLIAAIEEQKKADVGHACCKKPATQTPAKPEPTKSDVASCCHSSQPVRSTPGKARIATIASTEADPSDNSARLSLQLVIAEDYRLCHGTGSLWLLLSHAMPASVVPAPSQRLDLVGWLQPVPLLLPDSPALILDTPPPNGIAAA